jgi:hypothetical protein
MRVLRQDLCTPIKSRYTMWLLTRSSSRACVTCRVLLVCAEYSTSTGLNGMPISYLDETTQACTTVEVRQQHSGA